MRRRPAAAVVRVGRAKTTMLPASKGRCNGTSPQSDPPLKKARLVGPPTMHKTDGRWALSASNRKKVGTYVFDQKTMCLSDDSSRLLAKMVIEPLSTVPLKRPPVQRAIPVVTVTSSEIVREIQNAANADAYFVLPSQLNGAEYPDYTVIVSDIADYRFDGTGGPRGQLAAHPAVGQFLLDNASHSGRRDGIDATRDILDAMRLEGFDCFTLENGYLNIHPTRGDAHATDIAASFERHLWRLRTIAAEQVCASGLASSLNEWSDATHNINLVYASSVPVGTYNNLVGGAHALKHQQRISSLVMRGMYFGALRLALAARGVHGASLQPDASVSRTRSRPTKVFFMPIGGGVFNNSGQAIAQAMSEAIELADDLFFKHASNSSDSISTHLDVRVLAWEGKPSEAHEFQDLMKKCGKLRSE